jgi:hypothetical protein
MRWILEIRKYSFDNLQVSGRMEISNLFCKLGRPTSQRRTRSLKPTRSPSRHCGHVLHTTCWLLAAATPPLTTGWPLGVILMRPHPPAVYKRCRSRYRLPFRHSFFILEAKTEPPSLPRNPSVNSLSTAPLAAFFRSGDRHNLAQLPVQVSKLKTHHRDH